MWNNYRMIQKDLDYTEELIKANTKSRNKTLSQIADELVSAGGKRIRPALVHICSRFGRYERDKISALAGAVEILHTATLVHDDIVDRAEKRRGIATVSEKYGIDMAVYAGDFLFTKAVLMLSRKISLDYLEIVANCIKIICEGEVDQFNARFKSEITVFDYLKRTARKTAFLFAASCSLGAYAAGCDDKTIKILARFGMSYGMAFQLRDDLIDFTEDEQKTGKPVLNDLARGVITLPVIYAIKHNKKLVSSLKKIQGLPDHLKLDVLADMVGKIKEEGGLKATQELLDKYIKRSIRLLSELPDNNYRQMLENLALQLVVC